MTQLTVLCAEIYYNDLMEEIFQLYPYDKTENLQPFKEYMDDKYIDHKEVEAKMEVLREHGIIDTYNEFTEWSQISGVGIIVYYNGNMLEYKSLYPQGTTLISKQGKKLIEKLCP